MLDFVRNKPLTVLSGVYLVFSWVVFMLRLRFGLPPFSLSIIVGILILAALADVTGFSKLHIDRVLTGSPSPEITLLLMIVLAIFIIYRVEKITKAVHEYIHR